MTSISTNYRESEQWHPVIEHYDTYLPALYNLVLRIVDDGIKAKNVVLSVFVWGRKTLEDELGKREIFLALYNKCRDTAIEVLINSGNIKTSEVGYSYPGLNGPAFRSSLLGLPLTERTILALKFFKGISKEEIALQLNLPRTLVELKMQTGLEKLQQKTSAVYN